jgi:hypothetical protein
MFSSFSNSYSMSLYKKVKSNSVRVSTASVTQQTNGIYKYYLFNSSTLGTQTGSISFSSLTNQVDLIIMCIGGGSGGVTSTSSTICGNGGNGGQMIQTVVTLDSSNSTSYSLTITKGGGGITAGIGSNSSITSSDVGWTNITALGGELATTNTANVGGKGGYSYGNSALANNPNEGYGGTGIDGTALSLPGLVGINSTLYGAGGGGGSLVSTAYRAPAGASSDGLGYGLGRYSTGQTSLAGNIASGGGGGANTSAGGGGGTGVVIIAILASSLV